MKKQKEKKEKKEKEEVEVEEETNRRTFRRISESGHP
jgi:hypothetical protein